MFILYQLAFKHLHVISAYYLSLIHICGFKQTHQPSPWINDYGQFAIMPVTGKVAFDQDGRASWFSHKAETATPYYYKVYLADHDVTAEFAPVSYTHLVYSRGFATIVAKPCLYVGNLLSL